MERLEARTLLTAVLVQAIPNQIFAQDSGTEQANLYGVFTENTGTPDLTFSASSTNPGIVAVSVSGSTLSLTPVAGQSGFATIQMSATEPAGSRVSNSFRVQITASSDRALDVSLSATSPSVAYQDANHAGAMIKLSGPGSAVLHFGGDGLHLSGGALHGNNAELESITLSDTTAASTLLISGQKAGNSTVTLGNLTATGSLGLLQAKSATFAGDMNVQGMLPRIVLDGATDGTITVGSGGTSIQGGTFVDENFTSNSPISNVQVTQWVNSDNVAEIFSASFIRKISSRGNFSPGIQLSGDGAPPRMLDHVSIRGSIGGTWTIPGGVPPLVVGGTASDWDASLGAIPSLTVRGTMNGNLTAPTLRTLDVRGSMIGSTVRLTAPGTLDMNNFSAGLMSFGWIFAAGNIGTVTTHAMLFGYLFAGVDTSAAIPPLPSTSADFVGTASIRSVVIRPTRQFDGFLSSKIAASSIGSLQLGNTRTSNGGTVFGIAASSLEKLSVLDLTQHKQINLNSVKDAASLAAQLAAQNLVLADLAIRII